MKLSQDVIKQINDFMFVPMPQDVHTDYALVFGAKSVSGSIARKVAKDYHQRRFDKIMLFGGARVCDLFTAAALVCTGKADFVSKLRNDFTSLKTEAEYMRDVMVAHAVDENDIIPTETESKKLPQNAQVVKRAMHQFNTANRPHTAKVYCYAPFEKGIIGTLRHVGITREQLGLTVNGTFPFGASRDNWRDHPIVRRDILEEWRKINPQSESNCYIDYTPDGYMEAVCVPWEKAALKNALKASREPAF